MSQQGALEKHQQMERSDAGAKVTVACKLPHGIIIRAFTKATEREAVLGGGVRETEVFRPVEHQEHEIFGTSTPRGKQPKCRIVFDYALTPNVSKELFDNWYEANKDSRYVKEKLIFAYENAGKVDDAARENETRRTGFEMIDPNDPGKKVSGISKADKK